MMRHQHNPRLAPPRHPPHQPQKPLPRRRIQPRTRLIQNQQRRIPHQRPRHQHPLPLPLTQHLPPPLQQPRTPQPPRHPPRRRLLHRIQSPPVIDLPAHPAPNHRQRGLIIIHPLPQTAAHHPDPPPQPNPVSLPEGLPQHPHHPATRGQQSRQTTQQRCLPRPVRPQNRPHFPRHHPPRQPAQHHRPATPHRQPFYLQQRLHALRSINAAYAPSVPSRCGSSNRSSSF